MLRRGSGVLLHITSLPSPYGIGDFGPEAYRFADFLAETRQGYWQILPLNPTSFRSGNSPYDSYSVFAQNPLLLSPELLVKEGYLTRRDVSEVPSFPEGRVDYRAVTEYKNGLFAKAYENFESSCMEDGDFVRFCSENAYWLEDFSLFSALKSHFGDVTWNRWYDGLRDRNKDELAKWKEKLSGLVVREKVLQYLLDKQWLSLKNYCLSRGIQIIGDVPIYVSLDSVDVWSNPQIFKLDENKNPTVVAGVPPDYFSSTGQLWGNPIYRWDVLREEGYEWWMKRMARNLRLFDVLRLDHFKGFNDFWEVPATEKTALYGRWVPGPGADFFMALHRRFPCLPLIAEDLGVITAEVRELRDKFELPGMCVLQFAFGKDPSSHLYRPHNYRKNCVAYTGTHDNDTLVGWLTGTNNASTCDEEEVRRERENALNYIGSSGKMRKGVHWEFIRVLFMSVANLVILPMQDILGLGQEARMNTPSKTQGNWEWRLKSNQITPLVRRKLREMTETYDRA
ncbi:MAG: 4-alpha-glucanotransferase [Candidatus Methanosuratincola sp.]|jgi:4-alpha-glucanotransferase